MSATPLTDKAMMRLRALAESHQLLPDSIKLLRTEEKMVQLTGQMAITATLQQEQVRYAGEARGKLDRVFRSREDLDNYLKHVEKEFQADSAWQDDVRKDLEKLPGKGWAAVVPQLRFDERTQHMAATEPCADCAGRGAEECTQCAAKGQMICVHCNGSGSDVCDWCQGSGYNLQDTSQICNYCGGQRFSACRMCKGNRAVACPACRGRRVIGCQPCQGKGSFTQSVTVSFVADMHFRAGSGHGLPVAVRRMIDRQNGVAFLAKGHATIRMNETTAKGEQQMLIHYVAEFPAAEMTVDFAGRKGPMTCFGLKHAMVEVPPFLDQVLAPAVDELKNLSKKLGDVSVLRKYAAVHEALNLVLQGRRDARDLLRKMPIGLSLARAQELMQLSAKALHRQNMVWRWGVAGLSVALPLLVAWLCFDAVNIPTPWDWLLLPFFFLLGVGVYVFGQGAALKARKLGDAVTLRQPFDQFGWAALLVLAVLMLVVLLFSAHPPQGLPSLITLATVPSTP